MKKQWEGVEHVVLVDSTEVHPELTIANPKSQISKSSAPNAKDYKLIPTYTTY